MNFKNSKFIWLVIAFLLGYFMKQLCDNVVEGHGKHYCGKYNPTCVHCADGSTSTDVILGPGCDWRGGRSEHQ